MTDPISTAVTTISTDALTAAATPVLASLTNIENNPTALNAVAQFAVLQGAFIGVAPTLETDAIKAFATAFKTAVANALASATPTPAPAPTPEPAPVAAA